MKLTREEKQYFEGCLAGLWAVFGSILERLSLPYPDLESCDLHSEADVCSLTFFGLSPYPATFDLFKQKAKCDGVEEAIRKELECDEHMLYCFGIKLTDDASDKDTSDFIINSMPGLSDGIESIGSRREYLNNTHNERVKSLVRDYGWDSSSDVKGFYDRLDRYCDEIELREFKTIFYPKEFKKTIEKTAKEKIKLLCKKDLEILNEFSVVYMDIYTRCISGNISNALLFSSQRDGLIFVEKKGVIVFVHPEMFPVSKKGINTTTTSGFSMYTEAEFNNTKRYISEKVIKHFGECKIDFSGFLA